MAWTGGPPRTCAAGAPSSWLQTAPAPTTHELFSESTAAASTAGCQKHLYCPRGSSQLGSPPEREALGRFKGSACAVALRALGGAGRVESFPEASATRSCRSSRAACPALHVRASVAFVVPGAPWRSGGALRRPRAASVRQVPPPARPPARPRRHHSAPTCGGAAEPRGGREGGREVGGGETARHGGGGERRWRKRRGAALPGSTASWLACSRPGRPSPRAPRASKRTEESMVRNLGVD